MKLGFPSHSVVKNCLPMQETWVWSLGWEDPLERERATHSSFLAWEITWTEEPGRLQYMELQKSWASWATTQQQGNEITVKPSERQGLDSFQGGEHIQALRGWCLLPPPETCPACFWFGCVLYDKVAVINAVLQNENCESFWWTLEAEERVLGTSTFTASWQPWKCSWRGPVQSCWTEPADSDDDPRQSVRRELNCRLATWCPERWRVGGCEKEPHTFGVRSVVSRISPPAYSKPTPTGSTPSV